MEPVGAYDCIDLNLLESASQQPFQAVFGVELYPTIYDKAAYLFFSLAGGHIFTNGNKRTAVLALDQFLMANSIYLLLDNEEIRLLAEDTASYRVRGETPEQALARIKDIIEEDSASFSLLLKVGRLRELHRRLVRSRSAIRRHPLNQPDARPRQR